MGRAHVGLMPEVSGLIPRPEALRRVLRTDQVDAVHVVGPGPLGWTGIRAARRLDLPVLASFHTDLGAYARAWLRLSSARAAASRLTRRFYASGDVWTAPSEYSRRVLGDLLCTPSDRVRLLPQGVDVQRFGALAEPDRDPRTLTILCVSRLSPEKRLEDLIHAVPFLGAPGRVRVVLVGRGPSARRLRRLAARLRVHLVLRGALTGDDLARAYRAADLFCLPSPTETFGQVLLEAQASGLPCVVAPGGAAAETVQHGAAGFVALASGPASLANAIALVNDDAELRARAVAAGRAQALSRPWTMTAQALSRAYSELDGCLGAVGLGTPAPTTGEEHERQQPESLC
jgi:glycosyltransferase involved in cell wall biosynthesis